MDPLIHFRLKTYKYKPKLTGILMTSGFLTFHATKQRKTSGGLSANSCA